MIKKIIENNGIHPMYKKHAKWKKNKEKLRAISIKIKKIIILFYFLFDLTIFNYK